MSFSAHDRIRLFFPAGENSLRNSINYHKNKLFHNTIYEIKNGKAPFSQ